MFHSSRNASEFKNDNKEAQVTTSAAAKESEEFLDKDAVILRLIEERKEKLTQRRETTTEGPEQKHKKCIREKRE